MKRKSYWKMTTAGIAAALLASTAWAATPELLLDFQFNEGDGLSSVSSVGDTVLNLGTTVDPSWTPTGVTDSPSGQSGDLCASFNGYGWLLGEFTESPLDLTKALTWEAWIYVDPESTKTYEDYFNFASTFKVGATEAHNLVFTMLGIKDFDSGITISADGYWYHLACVWDPTGSEAGEGIVHFYMDGTPVGDVETGTYAFKDYQNQLVSIGGSNSGGSLFQGKMDRVRVYNKILESNDLDSDYANPKPLDADVVMAWDFDTETVPFNSTTTPVIAMESGPEIVGDAHQIHFSTSTPARDADPTITNDFSVYIDNSAVTGEYANKYGYFKTENIHFGDTSDPSFTIEAWFKGLSRSSLKQVFFQTWGSPNADVPRIAFAINTDFTVFITTMGILDIGTGVAIPEDGGWHHIACAYDHPAGKIYVYVDGQLGGEVNYNRGCDFAGRADEDQSHTPNVDESNCGMIGCEHSGFAPFTGYVDRIRFWKGVVSQSDLDYKYYGETIYAPTITVQPSNLALAEGIQARLYAKVVGTDTESYPMTYQWYKDGIAVEGATTNPYIVTISEETAGSWTLIATNEKNGQGGSVTSNAAVISVVDAPPYSSTPIFEFNFTEGEGISTVSEDGNITATIGIEYDPTGAPVGSTDSPSGADGDGSAYFNRPGWLQGWTDQLIDLTQPLTWEIWIKPPVDTEDKYQGLGTYGDTIKLGFDKNSSFVFTLWGIEDIISSITMEKGVWQHLAVVWEPEIIEGINAVTFYKNGEYYDYIETKNDPLAPKAINDLYRVTVGAEHTANPFLGNIDRIRLHQAALQATDLDYIADTPKAVRADTLLAFNLDEAEMPFSSASTPTVVLDEDGAKAASLNRSIVWSTDNPSGKEGEYSLEFDGSKRGTMPLDLIKLDRTDTSFTIESWVKPITQSYRQIIFAVNGADARISFSIKEDNSVALTFFSVIDIYTSAIIPDDKQWHHIAASWDGVNHNLYIFIDGVLANYGNLSGYAPKFDNPDTIAYLGAEAGGAYFVGRMARLHFYQGVMNPEDLDFFNVDAKTAPVIETVNIPTAVAGQEAVLSVSATGTAPLSYQWYKDGTAIEGATEATYTIKSIAMNASGVYTVVVSNELGEVSSDDAVLAVATDPSQIVKLLEFRMDEGTGSSTASSVNGAIAALAEPDPEAVIPGEAPSGIAGDYAVDFNSGNGWLRGTLPLTSTTDLPLTTAFTWEAWIYKATSEKTYEDFFRVANSVKIGMNKNKIFQLTFLGVADCNSEITIADNEWVHVAAEWEPGVGIHFYKNGEFVNTYPTTGTPHVAENLFVTIGSDNFGSSLYQGKIDRMRIHNSLLTAEELDSDAANPKAVREDTLLAYDFNETELPYQSTGIVAMNEYNMNAVIEPQWVTGPYDGEGDYALQFNGLAYANFNTDGVNFGDTTDASFTVEAWIKDIAVSTSRQVFFQTMGNIAGTCPRISFSISPDREVFFTTMGIADFNTGVTIPDDTEWHNIAAAWNAQAGIVYVYIDGALAGTKAYSSGVNFTAQTTDLCGCLGRELAGAFPTTGTIDRVSLWKGVLGPETLDYPPSAPTPVVTGPVLSWIVDTDAVILSWAVSDTASLEVAPTPNGPWTVLPNPELVGGAYQLTVDTTSGTGFYRLVEE